LAGERCDGAQIRCKYFAWSLIYDRHANIIRWKTASLSSVRFAATRQSNATLS
jgi:hypothetical protein